MINNQKVLKITSIILSVVLVVLLGFVGINKFKTKTISSCPVQEEIKTVRGNSLEPLVPSGSQIKALIGYYQCHEIKRGDLVLYRYAGDAVPLLKIAKGLPGDSFHLVLSQFNEYNLFINGKLVTNSRGTPYVFNGKRYQMLALYEKDYQGIIPKNTYLLLGDQAYGSVDASVFGLVDKSDIIGKAEKQ